MTPEKTEQLRRKMAEAALLPHEHPERLALVRGISGVDGPLEQEWLDLLREDERLRLELARVEPAPGLEERLLAIPRQHRPRGGRWLPRWFMAVAAVVLLLVAGAWWAVGWVQRSRHDAALNDLALLALAGDEAQPGLSITTPDWQVLRASFQDQFPRPLDCPAQIDPSLRLEGGKVMTLGGNKVLYTRWQSGGRTCSLYVFCAKDFGLRRPLERRTVTPRVSQGARSQVVVWTEGHCDYALVMEPREEGKTTGGPST